MKLVTLVLTLTFLFLSPLNSALAASGGEQKSERSKSVKPAKAPKAPKVVSPQQAAKVAQGRVGGKVLKVQTTRSSGQQAYRVKVLKQDGHIVSVLIDAQTGRVIGN